MTADRRSQTAYHESGHLLAAIALDVPIDGASLRPGKSFDGVMMFGSRAPDRGREQLEREIVVTLAGDVGARFVEQLTGKPTAKAERDAVKSLQGRAPATFDRLVEAEAADDHVDDETLARRRSWALNDYNDWLADAHGLFLRRWALYTVERHRHALHGLAAALYQRTVLDAGEVEAIVTDFRCVCHEDWGPPRLTPPVGQPRGRPAVSGPVQGDRGVMVGKPRRALVVDPSSARLGDLPPAAAMPVANAFETNS